MATPSGITGREETCFCCCSVSVSQLRSEHLLQVCLNDLCRYCATVMETQHVAPPPDLSFHLVQVDNKGRNFLHVAVQNSDIESVLFLISVKANVNSRVQDAAKLTPLHLAVQAGSEIIVRNLVRTEISCRYWSSSGQTTI